MSEHAAFVATVRGRVQGVYFRAFVERHARALGLKGYVRNCSGGRELEVWAEGSKEELEQLLEHVRNGPPRARVDSVDVRWSGYSGRFGHFGVKY